MTTSKPYGSIYSIGGAMNQNQRKVLLCTAIIIGLWILFPPYVIKIPWGLHQSRVIKSGHGFIFGLPNYVHKYYNDLTETWDYRTYIATINAFAWLAEILGTALVGGLVCVALGGKRKGPDTDKVDHSPEVKGENSKPFY